MRPYPTQPDFRALYIQERSNNLRTHDRSAVIASSVTVAVEVHIYIHPSIHRRVHRKQHGEAMFLFFFMPYLRDAQRKKRKKTNGHSRFCSNNAFFGKGYRDEIPNHHRCPFLPWVVWPVLSSRAGLLLRGRRRRIRACRHQNTSPRACLRCLL